LGNNADGRLHIIVTRPTKLAARKLEIARTLNLEPDPGDRTAGYGILIEPEPWNVEGMDDVAGIQNDVNRLTERNDELCRGKVVLAGFVALFDSKFVFVGNLSDNDRAELSICARVAKVPTELEGRNVDLQSIRRRIAMELGPQPVAVYGEAQKDEHGNGRPDDLKQIVAVGIMCSLTFAAAIPDKINDQNRLHPDENKKPRTACTAEKKKSVSQKIKYRMLSIRSPPTV